MKLQDRTALITGASRGLGRALAFGLAERGARVVLAARPSDDLDRTTRALRERGAQVYAVPADLADKHAIFPLAGEAAALAGSIDILINNASSLGPSSLHYLLDTECEELERALAVNLLAPFRLTKTVLGSMLLRERGVVVNISSDAGLEAYPGWGAYGISKAALDHLTRVWANELGASGLRIFSVDPGDMDTALHAQAVPDADRSSLADPAQAARSILQMIEQPERAANGARLLVSKWSSS